jgi:hypothetical protein
MMWALWIRSTLSTSWLIIGDELLRDCYVSKPGFQPWFSPKNSWNVGSSCPQDGLLHSYLDPHILQMNTDLARPASIFSTASTVSICMMLPKAHDQGWHLLGAPSHHILLVISHLLPLIAYHIAGTHLCPCFWVDLSWSNTLVPVGHLLLEGQICPAASCARFHMVNLGPKRNKCTSRCLGTMTWVHHDCHERTVMWVQWVFHAL